MQLVHPSDGGSPQHAACCAELTSRTWNTDAPSALPVYGEPMSVECSAQGNAVVVAAPTIGRLVGERRPAVRAARGSPWQRGVQFAGRTFVGMPASSWMLVDLVCVLAAVH